MLELIGPGLAAAGLYALTCWWWPFANCPRCHGSAKSQGVGGFRRCPRCRGTGRRLRIGRRILNHFSQARAKAAPDPRKDT